MNAAPPKNSPALPEAKVIKWMLGGCCVLLLGSLALGVWLLWKNFH